MTTSIGRNGPYLFSKLFYVRLMDNGFRHAPNKTETSLKLNVGFSSLLCVVMSVDKSNLKHLEQIPYHIKF